MNGKHKIKEVVPRIHLSLPSPSLNVGFQGFASEWPKKSAKSTLKGDEAKKSASVSTIMAGNVVKKPIKITTCYSRTSRIRTSKRPRDELVVG